MFESIKNYSIELEYEKNKISYIIQAYLWIQKYKNWHLLEDESDIPFFVFNEDVEFGNCFSSHSGKQKFGGIYATIPVLHPSIASKLRNTLVTLIYNSEHRKEVGNSKMFSAIITEWDSLHDSGLKITDRGKVVTVFFQLVLVLRDNLGCNEILSFIIYFYHGHPCRVCCDNIGEIKSLTSEKRHFWEPFNLTLMTFKQTILLLRVYLNHVHSIL